MPHAHPARSANPARVGARVSRIAVRVILFGCLSAVLLGVGRPNLALAQGTGPLAIFPFSNLRSGASQEWLGHFLQSALREALVHTGKFTVLPNRASALWRRVLNDPPGTPLPPDFPQQSGAAAAIDGTIQSVLQLTRIRLTVTQWSGGQASITPATLNFSRSSSSPRQMADEIIGAVFAALLPKIKAPSFPQPDNWNQVRVFYSLAPFPGEEAVTTPNAGKTLTRMARVPALEAKASAAIALEAILQSDQDAPNSRTHLERAMAHASAAIAAEPWNRGWNGLIGEIHLRRQEYYQAKTAASVALFYDPGSALALIVLAIESGLSSGRGAEMMGLALALDPFLIAEESSGIPLYQGGALDRYFAAWRRIKDKSPKFETAGFHKSFQNGVDHFEAGRLEQARDSMLTAAEMDDGDYRPLLYLARILILTDAAVEAVPKLKVLAAENPLEPDIHYYHGIALAQTEMFDSASIAFNRALIEDPNHRDALYNLSIAEMARKKWMLAMQPLRRLLLINPDHELAWLRLGIVYTNLQRWELAEEALHRVKAINPESSAADEWLVKMAAQREEIDKLAAPQDKETDAAENASAE